MSSDARGGGGGGECIPHYTCTIVLNQQEHRGILQMKNAVIILYWPTSSSKHIEVVQGKQLVHRWGWF